MNQVQINLIKSTWRQVVPIADDAASLFYRRLFEVDPGLASHFHGVDMPLQRKRLLEALSMVVERLDEFETIIPQLGALGRRHANYGASAEAYETVGAALLWTLEQGLGERLDCDQLATIAERSAENVLEEIPAAFEQGLGDAWSPAVEAAWREAYGLLSGVMLDASTTVTDDDYGRPANLAAG